MRQLASSAFDAITAVGIVVFVPAAALNRTTPMIAAAVVFTVLVAGRIVIERMKLRAH